MTPRGAVAVTGWGLYCACSWTWCIGLYLPVILVRELGGAGVAAFAIPNVLGAAGFGFVLADRERRERLAAAHAPALRWFSIAAVVFNVYFIGFLFNALATSGAPWAGVYVGGAAVVAGLLLAALPTRLWPALAAVIYAVSLATFVAVGLGSPAAIEPFGARPPINVLWLAPVMAFGFLLSPALDLTFHRAAGAASPRPTFAIFGIAFAVMLALSCAYRDAIVLAIVPLAHIAAQVVFSVGAHCRELRATGTRAWKTAPVSLAFAALVLLVLFAGEAAGERIYLRLIVLWALVFPSYVLLFVGPGCTLPTSRRNLLIWLGAMGASLPFYEVGFIHDRLWLPLIPLGAIVAFRIGRALRRRDQCH